MTKLIVESDNDWTKNKIKDAIDTEAEILRSAIKRVQNKLKVFENQYGEFNRDSLYGKVDDLELLEWEGELETNEKLFKKIVTNDK